MKVCLGGTFNTIHKGHEALLAAAFSLGGEVEIGLTSDGFAQKKRKAKPYAERKQQLEKFLASHGWEAKVREITDAYGFAAEPDFDTIVVSEETLPNAYLINARRSEGGLKPLKIVVIPIIKNENGEKISSSG